MFFESPSKSIRPNLWGNLNLKNPKFGMEVPGNLNNPKTSFFGLINPPSQKA